MYITNLKLKGYRNIKDVHVSPHRQCNIIVGLNAQGKTNILESIYLCAMGKSHRVKADHGLINFDKEFSTVGCDFNKDSFDRNITVYLSKKEKKIIVDNHAVRKRSELIGQLNCVMFCPDDLNLVKGSPRERRKFIDRCLCQLYPKYFETLSRYIRALRCRNADLKNKGKLIDVFDEQTASYGCFINQYRMQFTRELSVFIKEVHKGISGSEALDICYSCLPQFLDKDLYLKELYKARDKDRRYCTTQLGPHKEDMYINLNNKNAKLYGSQGQQRSIALSLKMSELYMINKTVGEMPVLLLDDVMSELDKKRRDRLLRMVSGIQTFITANHLEFKSTGRVWNVKDGNIMIEK